MTRFRDVFPLVRDSLLPAVSWSKPLATPHVPEEDECYGVPTGPRNSCWVLDLDCKNGKDGFAALEQHQIDNDLEAFDTLTVTTKSGGFHCFFAWDEAHPVRNRTNVLPGVDVRGDGGYVRHGGPSYAVTSDVPIAPAPAWLLDLVTRKSAGQTPAASEANAIAPTHPDFDHRVALAATYLQTAPVCVAGAGGDQQLFIVCCYLAHTLELPADTCVALMAGYNARCQPPWDESRLRYKLGEAAANARGVPGTFSSTFAQPSIAPSAEQAHAARAAAATSPTGWRRVRDPQHVYSFDLATQVNGGGNPQTAFTQKDITGHMTGPGASPEWCGVWQHNLFSGRITAVNPPLRLNAETYGADSVDYANIVMWYACHGFKVTVAQVETAIKSAASAAAFHPVRDYFATLPEVVDVKSADDYFRGIAGRLWGAPADRDAEESDYLRKFAVAAVRRIRKPGTKVDTMLVLAGAQGWNKSTLAEHLFSTEFFRDQMPPPDSKEAAIALEGVWCIEVAELHAFSRAQESAKKEWLARREDKYRPHYEKGVVVRPRQTVFIGTTNESRFLTDPTGARRYWPVDVMRPITLPNRDEFWAAACALESAGEPHWYRISEDPTTKSAGRHGVDDVWTEAILRYCQAPAQQQIGKVTIAQVLAYGLLIGLDKQDARMSTRAGAVLRRHYGQAETVWTDGRAQAYYTVRAP